MRKFTFVFTIFVGLSGKLLAQQPFTEMFCPIDTNWAGNTIIVPSSPLHYDILLKEGDIVHNLEKNNNGPLKGGFGSVYFEQTNNNTGVPIQGVMDIGQSTAGWLYMGINDNKQSVVGNGGGLLRMKVMAGGNGWQIDPQTESGTTYNYRFYDMDLLGRTANTDGIKWGVIQKQGNMFLYDGWAPNNVAISSGFTDTTDYSLPALSPQPGLNIPRYQNFGWLMEAARNSGKPLRKMYYAGRGNFGGLTAMSRVHPGADTAYEINIIYATQTQPAVLLMYEMQENKISAFKQNPNSYEGTWLLLNDMDVDGSLFPFTFQELSDIQKIALTKGATMFNRLGDICNDGNNNYFITEMGGSSTGTAFTDPSTAYSGTLAHHLQLRDPDQDGKFADAYGRILRVTPTSSGIEVKPYLEGGHTLDHRYTFSNPRRLSTTGFSYYFPSGSTTQTQSDAKYLVISEEVPDSQFRRNPTSATTPDKLMQEIYFLDMKKTNPQISDLRPFAIAPRGAEVGVAFSFGDIKWSPLFVSLRYPNSANTAPYHQSVLMAVSNFEEYFANPTACSWVAPPPGSDTTGGGVITSVDDLLTKNSDEFIVWPNPASRTLYFNKPEDVQLYDVSGKCLKTQKDAKELAIFDLAPGVYFIRNAKGAVKKIIIQ